MGTCPTFRTRIYDMETRPLATDVPQYVVKGVPDVLRGDVDSNLVVDVTDALGILEYLWLDGAPPVNCEGEADLDAADANDNEYVTVADYLKLCNAMVGGGSIPAPSASCDMDWSADSNGFDAVDPAYQVRALDVELVGNNVVIPLQVSADRPLTGLQLALRYNPRALTPWGDGDGGPLSTVGGAVASRVFARGASESVLVIGLYAENDGETLLPATSGDFLSIGSLRFHWTRNAGFPPVRWTPSFDTGTVAYRASLVDDSFDDHHPELNVGQFEFVRGNANSDLFVDISDAKYILVFLFNGGEAPWCLDSVDVNNDGSVDVSDAVYLFSWLSRNRRIIPEPYPQCGLDQGTIDLLGCRAATSEMDACYDSGGTS